MKKTVKVVILAISLGLLSGCNITAVIDEINPASVTVKINSEKLSGAEFNSGARNNLVTGGSYNVSYSLGNMGNKIKTTTGGGYQVYMTVQGKVLSEGP